MDPMRYHPEHHSGWLDVRKLRSAAEAWWSEAAVEELPDGLEARRLGVTQRFRFEAHGVRRGLGRWYLVVETEGHRGAAAPAERLSRSSDASAALAERYDADLYAGSATVVDGRWRLRARVPLAAASERPHMAWLARIAAWQRRFLTEGERFHAPDATRPGATSPDATSPGTAEHHGRGGVDEAAVAFADQGVTTSYGGRWRNLAIRLPWTVRASDDESEVWRLLRMLCADVVTLDVGSDVPTPDGSGQRVELRLRVPADVDHAEARRWVARLNEAEVCGDTPLVGIGAWSLDVPARTTALACWVHRARFPDDGEGAVDWRAIAAASLARANWCVQGGLPFFVHRYEHVHAWLRPRGVEAPMVGLGWRLERSVASSRQLADDVDLAALGAHLVSCARSTRSGPLLDHVSRAVGVAAGSRGRSWRCVHDVLTGWLRGPSGLPTEPTWTWAATGGDDAPVGAPRAAVERLPSAEVVNLLLHAEASGIAVSWRPSFDPFVLGFAQRPWLRGGIRSAAPPPEVARLGLDARVPVGSYHVVVDNVSRDVHWTEVLVHELAHVLLGHVGRHDDVARPTAVPEARERLPYHVVEAEVTMVLSVVLARRGVVTRQLRRLGRHLEHARRDRVAMQIDMWHVFVAAERLLAWCRDAPDAIGRREPEAAPRWGGPRNRATSRPVWTSSVDADHPAVPTVPDADAVPS